MPSLPGERAGVSASSPPLPFHHYPTQPANRISATLPFLLEHNKLLLTLGFRLLQLLFPLPVVSPSNPFSYLFARVVFHHPITLYPIFISFQALT